MVCALILTSSQAMAGNVPAIAGRMTDAIVSARDDGMTYVSGTIVGLSDVTAGTAFILPEGNGFAISLQPVHDYSGPVDVFYTLADAGGTTSELRSIRFEVVRTADLFLDSDLPALVQTEVGASTRFADIQMGSISQRLQRLHDDGPAGNSMRISFADTDGAITNNADDRAPEYLPPRWKPSDEFEDPQLPANPGPIDLGFWSSGTITIGEKPGMPGLVFTTGGMSFGADYRFDNTLAIGASGTLSQDYSRIGETDARLQGHYASVYAAYQPVPDAFIDTVAGVGQITARTARSPSDSLIESNRNGWQQFVSISGGYDYTIRSMKFSPYGGIKARAVQFDGVVESGGSVGEAMGFTNAHAWQVDAVAGARMNWSIPVEMGTLKPGVRAEYRAGSQGRNHGSANHADFVDYASYDLPNSGGQASVVELGTSLALALGHGAEIGTNYTTQRRSDDTRSQSLRVYVSGAFK